MSRSNPDVVRSFFEAIARRDVPAAFALLDPEVTWTAPASLPYGGAHRGVRAVADGYFRGFTELVDDDFVLAADELVDAGGRVVVRGRLAGHGRLSGRAFDVPMIGVWGVREGRVTEVEYLVDSAAFLDAVEAPVAGARAAR